MGDRGNIVMRFAGDTEEAPLDIYFYTHWRGSNLCKILRDALASKEAKARYGDDSYLSRIIFNHLQGDDRGETGFGISPYETDNEHPHLIVDTRTKKVEREGKSWTFEEFAALTDKKLPKEEDD